MNTRKWSALLATWAAMTLFLSLPLAASAAAAELHAAGPDGKAGILPSILSFHRRAYSKSGPEIGIFEAGGGDPAMNGSFVYIAITHASKALVWETSLNIRNISRISYHPGNAIRVEVTEDVMDANGSIINRKASYQFRFHIVDGELLDTLSMEKL